VLLIALQLCEEKNLNPAQIGTNVSEPVESFSDVSMN
jgi:hypothetical protein